MSTLRLSVCASFILGALTLAPPALAQSPDLENACVSVARNFLLTDTVKTGTVQSFPELKPAGVRFTYSTRPDVEKANMADWFSCEFETAQPPFKLVKFCNAATCYADDTKNPDDRRRFEEAKILMNRSK